MDREEGGRLGWGEPRPWTLSCSFGYTPNQPTLPCRSLVFLPHCLRLCPRPPAATPTPTTCCWGSSSSARAASRTPRPCGSCCLSRWAWRTPLSTAASAPRAAPSRAGTRRRRSCPTSRGRRATTAAFLAWRLALCAFTALMSLAQYFLPELSFFAPFSPFLFLFCFVVNTRDLPPSCICVLLFCFVLFCR